MGTKINNFIFAQIFLVLIFILAVIIYRTLVQIPLFQNETFRPVAPMVASMSGAMVNLVFIMMLGRVYEKLALKLTTWGKKSGLCSLLKSDLFQKLDFALFPSRNASDPIRIR